MPKVLITGGTGLIGRALTAALLQRNYEVTILTRNPPKGNFPVAYAQWNISSGTIDTNAVTEADYIIHLAGASVAEKRWTPTHKQEIVNSRVKSADLLMKTLANSENRLKAFVSASAIGWYGPDPVVPNPRPFTENDGPFHDFLGRTCQLWEKSVQPVQQMNKRQVILRTGLVLSNNGGAYAAFTKPLAFRLATILGSGKQIVSWIHIDDLVNMYIRAIEVDAMQGVFNAVAPNPVTNQQLLVTIAYTLHPRSIKLRIPTFALKAIFGEMSVEVLKSCTVSANKLQDQGFSFLYPTVEAAVKQLSGNN